MTTLHTHYYCAEAWKIHNQWAAVLLLLVLGSPEHMDAEAAKDAEITRHVQTCENCR